MPEQGGVNELQCLQQEIVILKRILAGCEASESTSKACTRLMQSILQASDADGFVSNAAGSAADPSQSPNQYHTAASGAAASDGGCCVVC